MSPPTEKPVAITEVLLKAIPGTQRRLLASATSNHPKSLFQRFESARRLFPPQRGLFPEGTLFPAFVEPAHPGDELYAVGEMVSFPRG